MDEHKLALLRAWWENAPNVDGAPRVPTQGLLGGHLVRRQVRRLLRAELKRAREELLLTRELRQGQEWWWTFIEQPVDQALLRTLRSFAPRRPGETDEAYLLRLRAIESELRPRLATFPRDEARP